jgi:protein-L-isoaspartate(D-aspartate) O-methyltransferase
MNGSLEGMVNEIVEMGLIKSSNVKNAFMKVDRSKFVFPGYKRYAYFDEPIPLGDTGQTISAPSMLGIMLEAMEIEKWHRVLEIGTGSGYSAALISEVAYFGGVVTVEYNYRLYRFAKGNLKNYLNVLPVFGDGTVGYPPLSENSEYDRIVIMASTNLVPNILFKQLSDDGFVLAPLGSGSYQELTRIWKDGRIEEFGGCVFVPLKYS